MHDKQFAYDFRYPTSKQQKLCHRFASCRSQMIFLSHPPPYALQQYLVANRPPNCVLHLTIYGLFLALPSDDDVVGRHSVYVVQFRSLAGTNDLYLLPSIIIFAPSVAISKQATIHPPPTLHQNSSTIEEAMAIKLSRSVLCIFSQSVRVGQMTTSGQIFKY